MGFKDECGVFGITQHSEAANLTYLGLYALQHRGQEAAGICAADGTTLHLHKDQGYVADIFDEDNLKLLTGNQAIGHTRYSTTGGNIKESAQPFIREGRFGRLSQWQSNQYGTTSFPPHRGRSDFSEPLGLRSSSGAHSAIPSRVAFGRYRGSFKASRRGILAACHGSRASFCDS